MNTVDIISELLLEAVDTKSTVLVDSLYSKTENTLKNKSEIDKLIRGAKKYFDKNYETIFDSGLTNRLFFLETDKKVIYEAAGVDPKEIKTVIKTAKHIKESWKIMNEPINTAAAMVARFLTINNKEAELRVFLTFYAFNPYVLVYHKYLPYGAQENIMKYTINNLSNKYIIKQTGSLYKTIEHTVMTSHELHKDALIKGTDKGLADYISSIRVRLNNFMKNIKNEYTINHKENKFMNLDNDSYEEDNFHMADNNSYIVQNATDTSIVKLTTYGADMKLVKIAAKINKVSENEIRNVVTKIAKNETSQAKRLMELILQLYLFEEGQSAVNVDVHSSDFLYRSIEIYKKSNTNDKIILEIKKILDEWLKTYSLKYNKSNREATLSSFRRAIYIYFILHIQQSH